VVPDGDLIGPRTEAWMKLRLETPNAPPLFEIFKKVEPEFEVVKKVMRFK
jgi:hypothetical protein